MHQIVFYIATIWTAALLLVGVLLVLRARTIPQRMLALETITLLLVALLALFAGEQVSSHYLDAALILAMLSFVGSMAAARYYTTGSIFS